ncbi:hypothetical protein C1646_666455 [Rhizophagus diaphanus]|nr:hypothetical protein C1646_666455 [Rhizophagus diaphanus] [Rhizophagus sp. MUCL 43196]
MVTHNSSNNFGDNIYESNSQTTVAPTYDTYMPVTPCNNVNNVISDQQLMMSNTISPNQQTNVSSPNHNQRYQQHNVASLNQQQYDAINNVTISPGRQPIMFNNDVTTSSDQQTNVSSPNHNQRYQQHNVASLTNQQQYDAINNVTISPGRKSTMSNNDVTTSSDQQPIPNQQYQQHNVVSPNHQQQYETAISNNTDSFIPGLNHHHNYQQPSDNNHHNSNNTNHNNNQQSSSNNDSPSQFFSPQSIMFPLSLNITINSPQTNFIIIPNSDIQQVLSFLNNPSSRF